MRVDSLTYVFAQLKLLGLGEPRRRDDYLRQKPRGIGRPNVLNLNRFLEESDLRAKLKASVDLCKKTTE